MPETINIQEYLTEGVEAIVKDALRATLRDPKESLFMARFAAASRKASERRARNEKDGLHVPSYLIASITSAAISTVPVATHVQIMPRKIVNRSASSQRNNGKVSFSRQRSLASALFF